MSARATLGVIGGSGFYRFLDEVTEVEVETPYGPTSGPVAVGDVAGTRVAFLARHGPDHRFPPHRVPYRANIWAMRGLGVRSLIGPCAAGSLERSIEPGDLVVCDQLIDRTHGRPDTFHDTFDEGPMHVSLAEPYDATLRSVLVATARHLGLRVHDRGTVIVVNGPRFSTRAEAAWHRACGADVVNMTQYPEVALAREAGIRYAGVALVTDYDTGVEGVDEKPVTQEDVFAAFERNVHLVRDLLLAAIPAISELDRTEGTR